MKSFSCSVAFGLALFSSFGSSFTSIPCSTVRPTTGAISNIFPSEPVPAQTSVFKVSQSSEDSITLPPIDEKDSTRWSYLLEDALRFNSTAASEILTELNQLRSSNSVQEETEAFLNNLLSLVDNSSKFPWWSRFRPFLARVSRRARRASLGRVLDLSTPSAEEQESIGDDKNAELRRRRRSLVVLIRALADDEKKDETANEDETSNLQVNRNRRVPAIVQLERLARREAKSNVKTDDMVNRLPPGLETPNYTVLTSRPKSKGGYEVRKYEPFTVCSVPMRQPRPADASQTDAKISNPQLAGASAFGALAGYLFGKNQASTAMKMTTPVLSQGQGEQREMSFVLPSEFWNEGALDIAPKPLDGSGVTLKAQEGGERAVVMFGGFAGKKEVEARTQQLLEGLENDKDWRIDGPKEEVVVAQYNDPFTPPWKRRNEVSIKVLASDRN